MYCQKKQGVISIVQSLQPFFHVESTSLHLFLKPCSPSPLGCIQISQKILKFFPRCVYLITREKEMSQTQEVIQAKITKPNYLFAHVCKSFEAVFSAYFDKKAK